MIAGNSDGVRRGCHDGQVLYHTYIHVALAVLLQHLVANTF
jgi:hypothetical protein